MSRFYIRMTCVSLLSLLILSGCGGRVAMTSQTIRFEAPQPDAIKVMTFNIRTKTILDGPNHWNSRKKIVYDILASNRADVIGLQEARSSQMKQIARALPQYTGYAAGRSNGKTRGESCPVLFRKDRFSPIDYGTFWFSNTPSKPGSKDWGNIWPRICTWVHLSDKKTGRKFYVYNVHLDCLSQNSRVKSARLLAQRIAGRKTSDPFIVMGDFNMELDNPAMMYLQNLNRQTPYPRMIDAWTTANPHSRSIGTRHGFHGGSSGPKIDHIPVSEGIQVLSANIDRRSSGGKYPSDHFPVTASLRLPAPSRSITQVGKSDSLTIPESIPMRRVF